MNHELNKTEESIFTLASLYTLINQAFESLFGVEDILNSDFDHQNNNFQDLVNDTIHEALVYQILLKTSSFIDEWNKVFGVSTEVKDRSIIIQIKKVAKPALNYINSWTGLREYRNQFIAHNFRNNDGENVFLNKVQYYVPNTNAEIYLLVLALEKAINTITTFFPEVMVRIVSLIPEKFVNELKYEPLSKEEILDTQLKLEAVDDELANVKMRSSIIGAVEQAIFDKQISNRIIEFKKDHENLMNEMHSRMNDQENERFIIEDGIHSPERYFQSDLRIAWMLKEPYDDNNGTGGGWALYEMFDDENQYVRFSGGHRATWHPITYVSYALQNGFLRWGDMSYIRNDHQMLEVLKELAFINAQKLPSLNLTRTNWNDLHNSIESYHDLLKRQIELLDPNVLIFGNTFHLYRKHLGLENIPLIEHGSVKYIEHSGKIYIDAYHPSQRTVKREDYVNDIIDVVENWRISS